MQLLGCLFDFSIMDETNDEGFVETELSLIEQLERIGKVESYKQYLNLLPPDQETGMSLSPRLYDKNSEEDRDPSDLFSFSSGRENPKNHPGGNVDCDSK